MKRAGLRQRAGLPILIAAATTGDHRVFFLLACPPKQFNLLSTLKTGLWLLGPVSLALKINTHLAR